MQSCFKFAEGGCVMSYKLTSRDVQKIMEQYALEVWQQIPIDNFCIGVPVGDPDPCIIIQVPVGLKDRVPSSVVLDTKEYERVEIDLKVTEDFIPMMPHFDTRIGI
ncbi:MAG: hypothetical protein G01um101448_375 [Parcubacteria group bacterium Gr01-1014_48]|nr:MAG: hypothetical protein Greene041614_234 [Parcubacteria group bacterium Greene0416_14]TSC74072.1 MAG: hypothetical protein G01um101448_375 [Parcubacteria group bacterium Gr01-1014_48]TSD01141.1 MAG: hypothetical protein Greene101415_444 [Parcubacteria group bacterium Greene1014_15]TSD08217.1 MAG: hypothetical protein Greene07144_287 [Parcubacteria group bacterium Greene0714_4]